MTGHPVIDADRLWTDLMCLGEITEPDQPYTRRSFSATFDAGRTYLSERMARAGLVVRIDAGGNLIGRLEGEDPSASVIMIGSHSDTVRNGGRFDGVAGVVAALEVGRALAAGPRLRHPLEVVDFLAEEPSDFGLSCIGSRAMVGQLSAEMLTLTDSSGRTLAEGLCSVGADPQALDTAIRSDLGAFVELHIEQGPELEAQQIAIGIVDGIVGIRRIEIEFEGEAAHAGTATMTRRRDAGVAAAATLLLIRETAEALAAASGCYFVATTGVLELHPGGANVVPGRSRLVVDARSAEPDQMAAFTQAVDRGSQSAALRAGVERRRFQVLSDGPPAASDPRVMTAIDQACERLALTRIVMASGAGHDAAFLARLCPSGMIFIPCRKGMSHTPLEWSAPQELAAGTAALLETVLELDRALPSPKAVTD